MKVRDPATASLHREQSRHVFLCCTSLQRQEAGHEEGATPAAMVLPGAISTKKVARVSGPPDNLSESASPVRASGEGKHWLDEPEDLGTPPPLHQSLLFPPMQNDSFFVGHRRVAMICFHSGSSPFCMSE